MGRNFFELELLFRVGGVGGLVHFHIFEVDCVKLQFDILKCPILGFQEEVSLYSDGPGLNVAEVVSVLGLVFLVQLVSHEHFLPPLDLLHEMGQVGGFLDQAGGFICGLRHLRGSVKTDYFL